MIQLFDTHIHTRHSPDAAEDSAPANCICALRAGLSGIAITDHCDMGMMRAENWTQQLELSVKDAVFAREQFAGRLRVAVGIELGQPMHEPQLAAAALGSARFDIVIAALHNLRDQSDFYEIGDAHHDKRGLLENYFEELLDTAQNADFDVLAHITYPFRYFKNSADTPSIRGFEEQLRAIFKVLANRQKALELNLSGLRRPGHNKTMPELWELKLYRACGGRLVTLASDAHQCSHVGHSIERGADILRLAGFEHQCFFSNRNPELISLY
jgi:histidinol-phosphatase (PHP family)